MSKIYRVTNYSTYQQFVIKLLASTSKLYLGEGVTFLNLASIWLSYEGKKVERDFGGSGESKLTFNQYEESKRISSGQTARCPFESF